MKYAKTEILEKTLLHSGFLMLREEGTLYQFPHLTFLEYFAGFYLSYCLFKSVNSVEKEEAKKFISLNKYKDVHSVSFSFMMQETAEYGIPALDEMFLIVDQKPRDIIGVKHVFLKVRFKIKPTHNMHF